MAWQRLACTVLAWSGAVLLGVAPAGAATAAEGDGSATAAALVSNPAENAGNTASSATSATAAAGTDDGSLMGATLDESIALAKARRISRLEREIADIEHELGGLPPGLNHRERATTIAMSAAAYESWLLEEERQELQTRIEHLKVRITLLEAIEHHQELLDRARLVTLQNAELELDTDQHEVQDRERLRREDLEDVQLLIAVRTALHERLDRVAEQVAQLITSSISHLPSPSSAPSPAAVQPVGAAPAAGPTPTPTH